MSSDIAPFKTEPPRFVILAHSFPAGHERRNHFDLMLEWNGVLLTFAIEDEIVPGKVVPATRIPDHRIEYLDIEGPVSGDRGSVKRVLSGSFANPLGTFPDAIESVELLLDNQRWEIRFCRSEECHDDDHSDSNLNPIGAIEIKGI
ncbi:MAG: hypothetical protein ACI87E_000061 [Mariniblastus sp.]|jgi:hypothetical protein